MDVMNRRTPQDHHTDNGLTGGGWDNLKCRDYRRLLVSVMTETAFELEKKD